MCVYVDSQLQYDNTMFHPVRLIVYITASLTNTSGAPKRNSLRSAQRSLRTAALASVPFRAPVCVPRIPALYGLLSTQHDPAFLVGAVNVALRGTTGLVRDGSLPGPRTADIRSRHSDAAGLDADPRARSRGARWRDYWRAWVRCRYPLVLVRYAYPARFTIQFFLPS